MKWIRFVVGMLVALLSIWGGAYVLHIGEDTWMEVPAFLTSVTITIIGVTFAVYDLIDVGISK